MSYKTYKRININIAKQMLLLYYRMQSHTVKKIKKMFVAMQSKRGTFEGWQAKLTS